MLLAAPALALAGCGGSSRPPVETAQQLAQSRALGSRALLRLSDFPTGWKAEPKEKNQPAQPQLLKSVANCLHVSASLLGNSNPATVESPDFSEANGASIENSVTFLPSVAVAKERLGVFEQTQTPSCLRMAVTAMVNYKLQHPSKPSEKLPAGVTVGATTLARISFPTFGEQLVAFRITLPIMGDGISIKVYLDGVFLREGRAGASLTFENPGKPVSSALEERLTSLTASRLKT
jgi:hypothetical protein